MKNNKTGGFIPQGIKTYKATIIKTLCDPDKEKTSQWNKIEPTDAHIHSDLIYIKDNIVVQGRKNVLFDKLCYVN